MFRMYSQYSKIIDFSNLPDPSEDWDLGDVIGEGTYGEVYMAVNKKTGECAAVKVMESIHEVVEEIEEEYLVLRDLSNHPNIPQFHGIYIKQDTSSEDQIWLVMEMCGRGSVTDLSRGLLKQEKRLDEALIAHIMNETLKGLNHLHKNQVMHRDVKGHNILITDKGEIKLVDFGVSGHLERTLGRRKTHVGTPYWMAPEVIACEQQLEYSYDIRCDVWSLGITAIELADGHPPLSQIDPRRALFKIPRNPPPTFKEPDLWSEEFKDFINKCLVKDFEERPFTNTLLNHKFLTQVSTDTTVLKNKLCQLTSQMERTVHEPDVTTKHGRLKSRRKSRRECNPTAEDLAQLEVLDEEVIVSQLFNRYTHSIFYTYIGDILLAVNPFAFITIYTEEYSKKYVNAAKDDNPPHIFAVADQSYQMMMHNKHTQCIVISGESGAGKTESANLLVQQLTQLGKAPNRTLEERILQVNPLMEAFGNAKTVINDNSSRFGKYLEMFFTPYGTVIGAKITEYLLEKSRVIYQAVGEQSFHIFYYIHDGLKSEGGQYHLKRSKVYRYISEYTSASPDIATLSVNRVKFKAIQHCFEIIGFQPEEVSALHAIVVGILHIGNIDFEEKVTDYSGQGCVITDKDLLEIVSSLLGIDVTELIEALTTTGMVAKGEVIIRNNTIQEAVNARDAMSKALYGRLFSWIVNRISTLLKPLKSAAKPEDSLVIGLLDIFGFENFTINSFEQICINIANEQIQYYFNQHIFVWEMQEYKNEGIDASDVGFVDNRPILDMFLMKPMGLLALLDEESHFPKATDQTLVDKFHQNIRSVVYSRPKGNSLKFCIEHYAGKVEYDAFGFLEKNRDRLPAEIVNIMRMSENSVVKSLFQTPLTKTGNLATGSLPSSANSSRSSFPSSPNNTSGYSIQSYAAKSMGGSKHATGSQSMTRIQQTVATYFRFSLMDLLAKMVAGTPHFVRCIKPNDKKDPDNFDSEKVTTQLRYTGVLETTRIRRQGYSNRILFADFIKRYHVLGYQWTEKIEVSRENCQKLLERIGLEEWALGNTKVFLKYYHVEELVRKYEDLCRKIILIQSCVRTWLARTRFFQYRWKLEKAALMLQKYTRGWMVRKHYGGVLRNRRSAAIFIQKVMRGYWTRRKYRPQIQERHNACIKLQSMFRGHMTRRKVKNERSAEQESAVKIQKAFRAHRVKVTSRELRSQKKMEAAHAALIIQKYFRRWRSKTLYQQLVMYKSQKETQLIYFGQQVEMYGSDVYQYMINNQTRGEAIENHRQPSSPKFVLPSVDYPDDDGLLALQSILQAETEKQETFEKERQRSFEEKLKMFDVDEMRMEHIRKMNEVKSLMPDKEQDYYNSLADTNKMTVGYRVQMIQNGNGQSSKYVPKVQLNGQDYAESTSIEVLGNADENSHVTRLRLAKSAAKAFMANKPREERNNLALSLVPKSTSSSSLSWDSPLQSAHEKYLSSHEFQENGHLNGGMTIDIDPKADRTQLYMESNKEEMAKCLEQEVEGSIVALWKMDIQNVARAKSTVTFGLDPDLPPPPPPLYMDASSSSSYTIPLPPPPPPMFLRHPRPRSEVLNTGVVEDPAERQAVMSKSRSDNFIKNGMACVDDHSLVNLRSRLRKTNFNVSEGTLRRENDSTVTQVDFRHVLKKKVTPVENGQEVDISALD
ncbi:myosin-IIIb-like [Gigantopelta aegis]|uniref:myosin-IIIb-like n=1 Tax=Gigantopelta aegis TaxID=1735272 RepID=UPI001B887916|nr:myosin-IIIb-like [Gigantopelta aegis]